LPLLLVGVVGLVFLQVIHLSANGSRCYREGRGVRRRWPGCRR
jgi:hypothetical protein